MFELELPWDRQPDGGARLDADHPLAPHIRQGFAAPRRDLTGQNHATVISAQQQLAPLGQAIAMDGAGAHVAAPCVADAGAWTVLTFGFLRSESPISSAIVTFAEFPGSGTRDRSLTILGDGRLEAYVYDGTLRTAVTSAAMPTDTPLLLAAVADGTSLTVFSDLDTASVWAENTGYTSYTSPELVWGYGGGSGDELNSRWSMYYGLYLDRALSLKELRALRSRPWHVFAPRRLFIPVYVSGGSYSDAYAESFSLSESITALVSRLAAGTDLVSLADSSGVTKAASAAAAEAVALADGSTSALQLITSATESTSLTDSLSGTRQVPGSVDEAATLSHSDTQSASRIASAQETFSLSHGETVAAAILGAIQEVLTLLDQPASDTQSGGVAEAITVSDISGAAGAYSAGMTDMLSMTDMSAVMHAMNAAITEALSPVDSAEGMVAGAFNDGVTESVSLIDSSTEAVARIASIIEALSPVDGLAGTVQAHVTVDHAEAVALAETCGGTVVVVGFGGAEAIYLVVSSLTITLPAADSEIQLPRR